LTWCKKCKQVGIPQEIGFGYSAFCNNRTSNAGKICKDSDECEGLCITENEYASKRNCSPYVELERNACEYVISKGEVSRKCD
jgi:hypothetical protein